MSPYLSALTEAMTLLGREPGAVFLGQAVRYPGTAMFHTFSGVPDAAKIELPVFENTQLGMSIGLSLAGRHPVVSIFPRINFLLESVSQLVQHLDKLPLYSDYRPRVIIRTAVAFDKPLDPGVQHLWDYSGDLQGMLRTVRVERLYGSDQVVPAYRAALQRPGSTILVEYAREYGDP